MPSLNATRNALVLAALLTAVAGCGDIRSHADFEALVKDKTTAEVEKKLGKPGAVEKTDGAERWIYSNTQTFSTDSGGTTFDKKTIVVFRKADPNAPEKVAEVKYESN